MTETRRSAVLAECRCKVTAQTARHLREGLRETYARGLALTWSRGCGVLALRPCRLAYAWRAMRLHDASPRSCVWAHTHAHIHPRAATHTPTRIHTCPPVCTHTSTHSQAYAHARPRLPPRAFTYAHDAPTYAGGQSRNRSCVTHTHAWLPSHDGMGALCARALRIRTQAHRQPPRVHVCAHVRLAPTLCAHESRPYAYARMGWWQAGTLCALP